MTGLETTSRVRSGWALWVVGLVGGLSLAGTAAWMGSHVPTAAGSDDLVDLPVVTQPPVVSASAVKLPDDCPVIGVSAGDRHRAYVVRELEAPERHVVNDVVGGVPVTVTYCDRTLCFRVFAGKAGSQPLKLRVGGWSGTNRIGTMLIRDGDIVYRQDTGRQLDGDADLPYSDGDGIRTTWGEWRAAHPDTDVSLVGPPPRRAGSRAGPI